MQINLLKPNRFLELNQYRTSYGQKLNNTNNKVAVTHIILFLKPIIQTKFNTRIYKNYNISALTMFIGCMRKSIQSVTRRMATANKTCVSGKN